jgi:hypothetical protein
MKTREEPWSAVVSKTCLLFAVLIIYFWALEMMK